MKKIIAIITALMLVVCCFAACGKTTDNGENNDTEATAKTFKVGICNYVDDASLNQIVANIKSQLKLIGEEKNVTFDIKEDNCNADANVLSQIIANFIADDVDLMVGIATPVAMAMQSATTDIPVVFAAVSDPLSVGLVDSLEAPGANITGTSDYLDTTAIMNLILAADEKTETVGLLYDAGQDSSTTAIAQAKEFLDSKGIKYIEKTGTNVNEISLAAQALIDAGVKSVFTPSDNTVMTAELSIYEMFANAGVKHFAGADSFALNGAFCGYGVDYANLGVESAEMVAGILIDGIEPASMPVRTFDNGTATVNTDVCAAMGLDYDIVAQAFGPYCTQVKPIETAESF